MAITRTPTTICPGETNTPLAGLRYRVVVSGMRVLDSAVIEEAPDNTAVPTGTVPSSAVPPFTLVRAAALPQETSMLDTTVTPMCDCPNYARVKSTIAIPMTLDLVDANGMAIQTNTAFTYPQDIVLYVPETTECTASFPYQITSEGIVAATGGNGDRISITIEKLYTRIITRVEAQTDMLIPCYGFAPVNAAVPYTNEVCRDFFAQPLFPNGRARRVCSQG